MKEAVHLSYRPILTDDKDTTVVTEYKPIQTRPDTYQTEGMMENALIQQLESQGYTYLDIHTGEELKANLREQLEKLNHFKFSDHDWQQFFDFTLANHSEGIPEKARTIQDYPVKSMTMENGQTYNITLLDKKNIYNNTLQVIHQYIASTKQGATHNNRYDVTILVNGLPLVHIELKQRGKNLREAFNQIERYQQDSFWSGSGLFEYIQIFIISNGTQTKYYSNTTRENAIRNRGSNNNVASRSSQSSKSFSFTSYWADAQNHIIPDLEDFTRTFLSKHTLLNILTKYCVFTADEELKIMRPYQIAATERILNRIEISTQYKKYGGIEGGGYIWHTTGSGKTLTSFKAARLASNMPGIDKVLFVVDRKDLDYQTMREYDKFEKGCANSNTNVKILQKQLEDEDAKIIITTIQKLSRFIQKNPSHPIYEKHVVIIFDECHRSQFGNMHQSIINHFKRYHIFGFTGTPIFAENANFKTTEQIFGDQLHTYTIVDAIRDQNVLPFHVDYIQTVDKADQIEDIQVAAVDTTAVLHDPERITKITKYILDHFNQKTHRNDNDKTYEFSQTTNVAQVIAGKKKNVQEEKITQRVRGFNSIFAVDSIPTAKLYYQEFKQQMKEYPDAKKLKIATIFSTVPNEDKENVDSTGLPDEEDAESTANLSSTDREFLDQAIDDYNNMFQTNYSAEGESFQNYYKDVSMRMKNRELDLLIVVNMFLTGFDAPTLNTLWVDKNLKSHGLIQAFSRTNRILNSVKNCGNIVCFRNLEQEVNDAVALFGDEHAQGTILLRNFDDYYFGYDDDNGVHQKGYVELIEELKEKFPLTQEFQNETETEEKEFIKLYSGILRMQNLLSSFDAFQEPEKKMISERDNQDYQSKYLDLKDKWRSQKHIEKEDITDDVVFEIELIKQVDINLDYILDLVQKYHDDDCQDKEFKVHLKSVVNSSPELRSKKDLIEEFVDKVSGCADVRSSWNTYVAAKREQDIKQIIQDERLKEQPTRRFMHDALQDGKIKTVGTDIDELMPSDLSLFRRAPIKERIIEKFQKFIDVYYGADGGELDLSDANESKK